MIAAQRHALLLLLSVLVSAVGLVETVTGQNWDVAVLLAVVTVLQLVVLVGLRTRRGSVGLRADLTTWVHEQAAATGEPAQRVVDRCVAACRAGLVVDPKDQP